VFSWENNKTIKNPYNGNTNGREHFFAKNINNIFQLKRTQYVIILSKACKKGEKTKRKHLIARFLEILEQKQIETDLSEKI
jgi:hypothetical protein